MMFLQLMIFNIRLLIFGETIWYKATTYCRKKNLEKKNFYKWSLTIFYDANKKEIEKFRIPGRPLSWNYFINYGHYNLIIPFL